jgi:hypothetical protein
MTTNTHQSSKAREAAEAIRRRRIRGTELQALASGGALAFTGLLLAVLYCLMTHRLGA